MSYLAGGPAFRGSSVIVGVGHCTSSASGPGYCALYFLLIVIMLFVRSTTYHIVRSICYVRGSWYSMC